MSQLSAANRGTDVFLNVLYLIPLIPGIQPCRKAPSHWICYFPPSSYSSAVLHCNVMKQKGDLIEWVVCTEAICCSFICNYTEKVWRAFSPEMSQLCCASFRLTFVLITLHFHDHPSWMWHINDSLNVLWTWTCTKNMTARKKAFRPLCLTARWKLYTPGSLLPPVSRGNSWQLFASAKH